MKWDQTHFREVASPTVSHSGSNTASRNATCSYVSRHISALFDDADSNSHCKALNTVSNGNELERIWKETAVM
jgi:hypothetical protein